MKHARVWLYALGLVFVSTAMQASEQPSAEVTLHIEPQPVRTALRELSAQSGVQILLRVDNTSSGDVVAPRLDGKFTVQTALDMLLLNTGLSYEFVNERTVRVSAAPDRVAANPAPSANPGPSQRAGAAQVAAPAVAAAAAGRSAEQPEITVWGRSVDLAPRVAAFVNEATGADPYSAQGLPRWQEPVCPLVSGLAPQDGEFIMGRISAIARAAGIALGGERCRPNLYILMSAEPPALLRAMQERNGSFTFGNASPNLIEQFIDTSRPVRVWYHTTTKTRDGTSLQSISIPEMDRQGDPALSPSGGSGGGLVTAAGAVGGGAVQRFVPGAVDGVFGASIRVPPSRLTSNALWTINRVFVIVDQTRLQGVSQSQLADYIAMMSLARVEPGAHLGNAPTVLTLFDAAPQAASSGMSDWDRAFLKALYAIEPTSTLQRRAIARYMEREIGCLPPAGVEVPRESAQPPVTQCAGSIH